MTAIFGEGKLQRVHSLDTLWVKNFDEIALSRTVKEIEANLCFNSNSNSTFIALNLYLMIDSKPKSEIVIVKSGTLQGSIPRRKLGII